MCWGYVCHAQTRFYHFPNNRPDLSVVVTWKMWPRQINNWFYWQVSVVISVFVCLRPLQWENMSYKTAIHSLKYHLSYKATFCGPNGEVLNHKLMLSCIVIPLLCFSYSFIFVYCNLVYNYVVFWCLCSLFWSYFLYTSLQFMYSRPIL